MHEVGLNSLTLDSVKIKPMLPQRSKASSTKGWGELRKRWSYKARIRRDKKREDLEEKKIGRRIANIVRVWDKNKKKSQRRTAKMEWRRYGKRKEWS